MAKRSSGSASLSWSSDPLEAVDRLRGASTIVSASGVAEPTGLTDAIAKETHELGPVELHTGLLLGGYGRFSSSTKVVTWFPPGSLVDDRANVEVLPLSWTQVDHHIRRLKPDVALLHVAPPDRDGYCSVGLSSSHVRAMVESSTTVIAQVNEALPCTHGLRIHVSEIDVAVAATQSPPSFPARPVGALAMQIGAQVASTIGDGSAVQLGIGSVPHAVAVRLAALGRRDLLIVGQLGDWVMLLDEAGCLADEPMRVSEIGGSPDLYAWVQRDKRVQMLDVTQTHGWKRLDCARPVVSVNSVLEIDMWGQANCESIDGVARGPLGGLHDFAIARRVEYGDRFILAIPSTTRSRRSRLVHQLSGPVSLARGLVSEVVTEYGSTCLDGLSEGARRRALASLAAAEYRDLLDPLDGR